MPSVGATEFVSYVRTANGIAMASYDLATGKELWRDDAVPGMDKRNLKIEVKDDVLTISAEQKEEKQDDFEGYRRREFSYSSFCRSFYLPEDVNGEKIGAAYRDGILNVEIPKLEEEKKKEKIRTISIS
mgnify:CR=1 FL=1